MTKTHFQHVSFNLDTYSYANVQALVQEDLYAINKKMGEVLHSTVPLIPLLGHHLIAAGGKRIRPMVMILVAKLFGYEGQERIVTLGSCLEFIHGATLLHDDVVDESDLRRGKATANSLWGNTASVLVGDFLFSRAFQLMVKDGSLEVLKVLSSASAEIVEGEVQQLSFLGTLEVAQEEYVQMIGRKTASLFKAAAMVGALMAQQSHDVVYALGDFGHALGMMFQLQDDILDYTAHSGSLGKNPGDDFREGKVTLPVILAYSQGSPAEKEFWHRTLTHKNQTPEDFSQALSYLYHHHVFDKIDTIMNAYAGTALDTLQEYKGSYACSLRGLIAYGLKRST